MSFGLNSLTGYIKGIILGTTTRILRGDIRSLDNGSYTILSHYGKPLTLDPNPLCESKRYALNLP